VLATISDCHRKGVKVAKEEICFQILLLRAFASLGEHFLF